MTTNGTPSEVALAAFDISTAWSESILIHTRKWSKARLTKLLGEPDHHGTNDRGEIVPYYDRARVKAAEASPEFVAAPSAKPLGRDASGLQPKGRDGILLAHQVGLKQRLPSDDTEAVNVMIRELGKERVVALGRIILGFHDAADEPPRASPRARKASPENQVAGWLSASEAAFKFKVPQETVKGWTRNRKVELKREGNIWLLKLEDVRKMARLFHSSARGKRRRVVATSKSNNKD